MNLFAKVFLCSRKVLAVTLPSIIISLLTVEVATAQPQCFMIDTFGKLVNLELICNVQPKTATGTNSVVHNTIIIKKTEIDRPLTEKTYLLGDGSIPVSLNTSRAIYYYGDRPLYIRRYSKFKDLELEMMPEKL
jgi:hypothetical protein